jgi:peptidoglycan hydrolase-like protein with peptidoglycan-binding domain
MRSKHTIRSLVLAQSAAVLTVALIGFNAFAMPVDTYGGADSTTQTISHCGLLTVDRGVYTNKSRNTVIIQRKLAKMGYYRGAVDGLNTPLLNTAVAKFQFDYGLQIDGVVGQETAQAIAYLGHSLANVRACKRTLNAYSL